MAKTLSIYQRLSKFPMGNVIFSKALAFRAPYFSTLRPLVTELRSGYCRVQIKDRRKIQNHIGSINAGALCTLSELVGGLAVEASLPSALRWIPKDMTVKYAKMAKGKLTGTCSFDPKLLKPGDVSVSLEILDESGDTVSKAIISFYVSHRK